MLSQEEGARIVQEQAGAVLTFAGDVSSIIGRVAAAGRELAAHVDPEGRVPQASVASFLQTVGPLGPELTASVERLRTSLALAMASPTVH